MFSNVIYKDLGKVIAQVDRNTGELFINPTIWAQLTTDKRDFILLHEKGHLQLQTADEYQANHYAVEHYFAGQLSEDEFGRRIVILSELLSDTESIKPGSPGKSNFDPITTIVTFFTIDSKKANNTSVSQNALETETQTKANTAENKQIIQYGAIILGVLIVAILVIYLIKKQ